MQYILTDTSPLIHLAMLRRLDLLSAWGNVIVPDMVLIEALRGPEQELIGAWVQDFITTGALTISTTDSGEMYRLAIQADPNYRAKNMGEYDVLYWIIEYLDHTNDFAVLLYENGKIPRLISEWSSDLNIDIMNTRYFLTACQERGLIPDAKALWESLLSEKPTVNPRIEITQIRRSGP